LNLPDLRDLTKFDSSLREVPADVDALTTAIGQAESELGMAEAAQQNEVIVRLLGYLGNACRILGRTAESVNYLERAVFLCRMLADRRGELVNTVRLAEARKYSGDHSAAEQLLRTALTWTDEEGLSNYKDFILQHLGKCRLEQGAADEAVLLLEGALALRLAKGDRTLIESTKQALTLARSIYEHESPVCNRNSPSR
jgi:tetratricopeptide (TPR) repeat protein